ncbi:carbohydrate ABC transporter permease [Paenibacillus vulneris]|uniref:Carbohydrate ABC transporter permease n=1 Tax=Paenibacillus vulneris TaxID=1133364 RepID=A0ABW3UQ49_9BACL
MRGEKEVPQEKHFWSRTFNGFNYIFLSCVAFLAIAPFVYIVACSFATEQEILQKGFILFPTQFTLDGYKYIFSTPVIFRSLMVSILITIVGTFINLLLTSLMAYPLSRKDMLGRQKVMFLIVFSMLFSGGMIPTFLVVKAVGLLDSYWSLILPGAINAFNLIVLRNFFQQLPDGLEEAAKMDGCNDLLILFRIVLPLSMPALVTFGLFYAVGHWNSYFSAIMFINDASMWPVQVLLRQIVIMSQSGVGDADSLSNAASISAQTIKMATIVISTLPILMVYPFLQKHFAKGVLLGSVKG